MKVEVITLNKIIRKASVLSNINLTLEGGNIYGLYGKNGCGKTMLLRALAGLIIPTEGHVVIDGKILRRDIDFPESIGVMIENPWFFPQYTGFENLRLLARIQNKINNQDIRNTLHRVGLDPEDHRKVRKYSLGMKQRLGIASAVMEDPDLLLLDEPFNAIDESGVPEICAVLQDFRARGKLVVLASHDREELESLSDKIMYMKDGRIIEENSLDKSKRESIGYTIIG